MVEYLIDLADEPQKPVICCICNKEFIRSGRGQITCSKECTDKAWKDEDTKSNASKS
jgi:hypothetical protein